MASLLISRIDELNVLFQTAIGYVVLFSTLDEIKTPRTMGDFDNIHTDLAELDELKTADNGFNGLDSLRNPDNGFKSLEEIMAMDNNEAILKELQTAGKQVVSGKQSLTTDQKTELKKICDEDFLEYLIFAYTDGIEAVNQMLTTDLEAEPEKLFDTIDRPTADKTATQRVNEHIDNDSLNEVGRVFETEMHRVYNDAVLEGGIRGGATTKTWMTMLDDKVRETHDYLEGMTVDISDKFYTYDGDSARYPGDFEKAENNCNCRCFLTVS